MNKLRKAWSNVKSRFDGATKGTRSGHAYKQVRDVNDSLSSDLSTLRGRSMGAYLNSPMASSAIDQWVSDEIGSSASITAISSDLEVNKTLNTLWAKHNRFLDFGGVLDFNGILTQATRERRVNGEVFIRRVNARTGRYPAPFQIQLLNSSSCPVFDETISSTRNVKQGIEFTNGRKTAVYFFKPGHNPVIKPTVHNTIRIPMRNLIHAFDQKFPGQIRGIPSFATAMLKESDYNYYEEAELNRKSSQSSVVGMITRSEMYADDVSGDFGGEGEFEGEGEGAPVEDVQPKFIQMGPNQLLVGEDGEDLKMNTAPDVGQNYKDFTTNNQRLVSIAAGLPPQLVTHNYEGLNDRTLRQINNSHRRKVRGERNRITDFQVAGKIWRWFVDSAVLAGYDLGDYWTNRDDLRKYRLTCEAHAYDHATQDLQAAEKAITLGVKSQQSFCEERGENWEQNLHDKYAYQAKEQEIAKQYGFNQTGQGNV